MLCLTAGWTKACLPTARNLLRAQPWSSHRPLGGE